MNEILPYVCSYGCCAVLLACVLLGIYKLVVKSADIISKMSININLNKSEDKKDDK